MRIGKHQKKIIQYINYMGGKNVYIGQISKINNSVLHGYSIEEIEKSLDRLVKRNILSKHNYNFYSINK